MRGRATQWIAFVERNGRMLILAICALAFFLRAAAGFLAADHFWAYTAYLDMANTLVHGGGYCMTLKGELCAYFPPVYPTLLAACILTGHTRPAVVIASSLVGAGTVAMTFLIGRALFGAAAGLLAALYASVYPYFVWHDAVVQENATLAFVVAIGVYLLVRSDRSPSRWLWFASGAAMAVAVLTKANLLTLIPLVLVWILCFAPGGTRVRTLRTAIVTLGVAVLLAPWLIRNQFVTGSPILYSNGGFSLWTSNHRLTFDFFPEQSIDAAAGPEWDDLTPSEKREFENIRDPQGIQQTVWYWKKGAQFIREHPGLTVERFFRKIGIAFSPWFSPRKGWAFESIYLLSYLPVLVGACAGAWVFRRRWRDLGYIYALIAAFMIGSGIFWAHTSHRMYLEPYLIVLAAGALVNQGRYAFNGDAADISIGDAVPEVPDT